MILNGSGETDRGFLFDVQGFSVHDGPGCRTLIFLKGCSLKCDWCSNPEGISPFAEPMYNASKCINDDLCINACNSKAISKTEDGFVFDRDICRSCTMFDCADACCTSALRICGYSITVDKLYEQIKRDRHYWGYGGGITLTGGEPFVEYQFAAELLKKCHRAHIHTAVETCGNVPWENIEHCLPWIDWMFFDLKQMDQSQHKSATGSLNSLILANALKVAQQFSGTLIFRMPVIPGYNDSDDHIITMAAFIRSTGKNVINILPVHHLGREKYKLTGRSYYTDEFVAPTVGSLTRISSLFEENSVHCYIGSDTPF